MFIKTLLATSALVVASSMAVAATHQIHTPTLNQLKASQREHLIAKGIVVNEKGFQLAVRALGHSDGNAKNGKALPPKSKGVGTLSDETNALFVSWFGWFAGGTSVKSDYAGSFCYSYNASDVCINHYKYKESFSENIHQSAAQPFTGAKKAAGVSIGAAQYSGSGGAAVAIYSDNAGNPGNKVAGAGGAFSTAPAFTGQCCSGLETVTFKKSVKLTPADQYWVVVSQNGSANGRIAWNGQASNWTALGGEQYNYTLSEKIYETYGTTAHTYYCGGHCTYKTTINENSGGWIHTSAYSYSEPSGGFRID